MKKLLLLLTVFTLFGWMPTAHAGSPGWITACQFSHSAMDDPIVFPGSPGASHMHDFTGSQGTDAFSTPETLRAAGTTCLMPDDSSAYWVPAMYVSGERILPTATQFDSLFYYRRKGVSSSMTVQPFPDGLKIIIGNANAASPAENPQLGSDIIFKCGPGSGTNLAYPPDRCADSGVLSVSIRFPNCWDGFRLDSADHRSHMAYPVRNRCPASHPVALPRLESFFRYPVGSRSLGDAVTFASGPWFSIHQDFFNGWDPDGLQRFVTDCINALIDCKKNPA